MIIISRKSELNSFIQNDTGGGGGQKLQYSHK